MNPPRSRVTIACRLAQGTGRVKVFAEGTDVILSCACGECMRLDIGRAMQLRHGIDGALADAVSAVTFTSRMHPMEDRWVVFGRAAPAGTSPCSVIVQADEGARQLQLCVGGVPVVLLTAELAAHLAVALIAAKGRLSG